MKAIHCVCLLMMLVSSPCFSYVTGCQASAQQAYAELNQPLRVAYAGERAYLAARAASTDNIHRFVVSQISEMLDSHTIAPDEVIAYLRCLQNLVPENSVTTGITNLPALFPLSVDGTKFAVGYDVFRGWGAVPDDRYYFDVFTKSNSGWSLVDSIGSSFDGSTLFIYPISAGKTGERWFVFSGRLFGNTGGALHLEVIGFNGTSLRSIWQATDMKRASLERVTQDHVFVSVESTDKSGHYLELHKRFDVDEGGLKEAQK